MYLEAITYKLALNFLTDASVGEASVTSLKLDFYDVYTGKHEKYNYIDLAEAVKEFNETYTAYQLSDKAGFIVGVESFTVNYSLGYSLGISTRDVIGNYVVTTSSNDKASDYLKRITDFQKSAVEQKVIEYRNNYFPFIDPYSTIYAFIYARPGYFKHTTALDRERIRIMNKQI